MSDDWKFIKEVHLFKELPSDQIPEFIFWGRSNVGKSSLINSLTKKKIAKTSRKYAVPILEYLDKVKITYREDNFRKLL